MITSLTFLIPSFTVRSKQNTNIKSLTSGYQRVDVLARCVLNTSHIASRSNYDVNIILYLAHEDEQCAYFLSLSKLVVPLYTEYDALQLVIDVLNQKHSNISTSESIGFQDLIFRLKETCTLYYLTSEGKKIDYILNEIEKTSSLCFILGSQNDLDTQQQNFLSELKVKEISILEKEVRITEVF